MYESKMCELKMYALKMYESKLGEPDMYEQIMSDMIKVIYILFRRDYDFHEADDEGKLALPIGIFLSADTANEAALMHYIEQAGDIYYDECYDKTGSGYELRDGLYVGWCYTLECFRDYFEVWVEMMKFGNAVETYETKKRKLLEKALENLRRAQGPPRARH
ncbi:hypothetical protein K445DRAFT_9495 [Daldinia sp. EC12]|nr:hypothetical protein K445DRAFT_9495 [Daldinia sp. EC12]